MTGATGLWWNSSSVLICAFQVRSSTTKPMEAAFALLLFSFLKSPIYAFAEVLAPGIPSMGGWSTQRCCWEEMPPEGTPSHADGGNTILCMFSLSIEAGRTVLVHNSYACRTL